MVAMLRCYHIVLAEIAGCASERRADLALFERRLCRRNPTLGEASEGAVEAPSEGLMAA